MYDRKKGPANSSGRREKPVVIAGYENTKAPESGEKKNRNSTVLKGRIRRCGTFREEAIVETQRAAFERPYLSREDQRRKKRAIPGSAY